MLGSLHIENVATIKKLNMEFDRGFSIMSGETGAGKSMIIDSINILLGKTQGKELIRNGEDYCLSEAIFTDLCQGDIDKLAEIGVEPDSDDGTVSVSKKICTDGKVYCRINGRNAQSGTLRRAVAILITIHGQHDNQRLFQSDSHTEFVDSYAHNTVQKKEYTEIYNKYCEITKRITALNTDEAEKARVCDMLKYQINEISEAKLKVGEEEALIAKKKKIQNSEKLLKASKTVYRALFSNEKGISAYDLIGMAQEAIERISSDVDGIAALADKLGEYRSEIEDIAERVKDMTGIEEGNPTAILDKIETRLNTISHLERKYGAGIEEILEFEKEAREKLSGIENSEQLLIDANAELEKILPQLKEKAKALSISRAEASKALCESVMNELRYLDMEKVKFTVAQNEIDGNSEYMASGCDSLEFLISANPGEPPKPLAKIASGGELSRIMLALRSVLSESEGFGTQIFDEIDTGVSGKTAQKIGIKLLQISENSQVICITHLAQIAALADNHYFIKKDSTGDRALTTVTLLTDEERVNEVARILGGIDVTETQKNAAREMMSIKNKL